MSVLIKGMDKETAMRLCSYAGIWMEEEDFIEIPPHGSLIDMDAVYEYLEGMQDLAANVGMSYEARCVYAGIIADLREMPTVLEAEGRENE